MPGVPFVYYGEEIGMEVRENHVPDSQLMALGEVEVLLDVALRVDNRRRVRVLVADEIRRVRKATESREIREG